MAKKRVEDRETCSCGRRAGFRTVSKTGAERTVACRSCNKHKTVPMHSMTYSYEVTKGILRSGRGLK